MLVFSTPLVNCCSGPARTPLQQAQAWRTIKTQYPKCRLYWCLIEFIDWRYSHVGIFDPSCELLPLYLLSDLPHPSPLHKVNIRYKQTVTGCGGRGGVLSCVVDHILQEFNTLHLTRFRIYKNATLPPNKNTSKDDI
jgi:hypothetical protein